MGKLQPTIPPPRGFSAVKFGFNPGFAKVIARWPGVQMGREFWNGWWLIPWGVEKSVERAIQKKKLRATWFDADRGEGCNYNLTHGNTFETLHDYQRAGALLCLSYKSFMLNYEPGLGKTPTSIVALQLADVLPILVVCPANVRRTWKTELVKWGEDSDDILLVEHASDAELDQEKWTIVSYELADTLGLHRSYNAIVLDEAHKIKNLQSGFNHAVTTLSVVNPNAFRIALTATPLSYDPTDLYAIVDWLVPGFFGHYWHFAKRFCNTSKNNYGTTIDYRLAPDGSWDCLHPDPQRTVELRSRVKALSQRVTRSDVAHLLPAFDIVAKRRKAALAMQQLYGYTKRKDAAEASIANAHKPKVAWALEELQDLVDAGERKILLATHLKVTAKALFSVIQQHEQFSKMQPFYIDGEVSHKKRDQLLAKAASESCAIAVCTMHSVLEGINSLTQFTSAICAELYYVPRVMIQFAGRFSRLNSLLPSRLFLLIYEGTIDEPVALKLVQRSQTFNKIFKPGSNEKQLTAQLTVEESDDDFLASLDLAALSGLEK